MHKHVLIKTVANAQVSTDVGHRPIIMFILSCDVVHVKTAGVVVWERARRPSRQGRSPQPGAAPDRRGKGRRAGAASRSRATAGGRKAAPNTAKREGGHRLKNEATTGSILTHINANCNPVDLLLLYSVLKLWIQGSFKCCSLVD